MQPTWQWKIINYNCPCEQRLISTNNTEQERQISDNNKILVWVCPMPYWE